MKCPFCSSEETRVIDKRESGETSVNRRRRECLTCKKRFTTYERIEGAISKITHIKKRDGTIVGFDQNKITEAIWKSAQSVGGKDKEVAKSISDKVVKSLERRFEGQIPEVEQIQDLVEKILIEEGKAKTAKAYILYRQKKTSVRDTKRTLVDVIDTISDYLDQKDWRVRENSNEQYSFSGLLLYTAGKVMANYNLNEMYTPLIADAHKKGYIHVHDLSHGVIGYSFYRNEVMVVRDKITKSILTLSLEQLFDLVDSLAETENGFEIKYTNDYEVLDEGGWTKIERVLRHKSNKPLISFNTINGHNMIVTADHPFITLNEIKNITCPNCDSRSIHKTRSKSMRKNDIEKDYYRCKSCKSTFNTPVLKPDINKRLEKHADQITMNNYIITPNFEIDNQHKISMNPIDGWFIGLFIAEGYYKKKYLSFEMVSEDPVFRKLLSYLDGNGFKYNLSQRSTTNSGGLQQMHGMTILDVPLQILPHEMQTLFGTIRSYSENKNLPIEFMNYSSKFVGGMISGIIDGDGITRNDDIWVSRANLRMTSKTLLSQIQFWMESQNINSSLCAIDSFGERKYNDLIIKPSKQLYSLTFFIPKEKSQLFGECLKIDNNFKYSHKFYQKKEYSNPRKIEYVKNDNEYVYDITTASNTFLCNGVLAHNCAGWSLKNLLLWGFGGVPNKVDCKPAKHLSTVIHQMVNYIGCLQMEFAGAQAFSTVDVLLAPFVKADDMTYKQVKQAMQQLVFSLNIPSRWGCFSEDTEILTDRGWLLGKNLKEGDIIATFNTNNEEIEYLPVKKMTKYHHKGKMCRLKNRITDQLVTPNHRVLRRIHNYKEDVSESKYVFEEADKLKTNIPLIPLGGRFSGLEIDESLVKSLAWIVSEGSLCKNERIVIYQSSAKNPDNCQDIRDCLDEIGVNFDERIKQSGFTGRMDCLRFRMSRPASREMCNNYFPDYVKRIPDELRNLSTPLARTFIDTYMKADGWPPENKIFTKNRDDADILQEIIAKTGWGSTRLKNKNGIYVIRVIKHDYTQISSIDYEDYNGLVWCPTTKNNTVVVRRKGKVFISGNSQFPFSNLTFDWNVPKDLESEAAVVGGKPQSYVYGDLQEEVDMVNRAFLEVIKEGDANGRNFTFPIPTYNLTKNFDWGTENADLLFDITAKYGTPYFQNYIGSNLDPSSIRAMCCRLNVNQNELMSRPGHIFAAGDSTGSIGVVTMNMNRFGYEAKNEEEFFDKLRNYMDIAKSSLEIKRKVVEKNLKNGLMPYTRRYLKTFNNHFSTIGLCGMNEACMNLLGTNITSPEGKKLTIDTLKFMRDIIKGYQNTTGNLYNLEATPAESTSYRFARADKKLYPDIFTSGKKEPFLTNSTQLPVNFTDNVIEAIEHQNDIQHLYTGGTIFHTFLGERMNSGESCKNLVRKIATNTRIPYFSITPTFSICPVHGYIPGEHHTCPHMNNGG